MTLIIGRIFHAISPTTKCYLKPQQQQMIHIYNLLAQAYLPHRQYFQRIRPQLAGPAGEVANLLYDFFEFFLPIVR